jgi:hypothetical protein
MNMNLPQLMDDDNDDDDDDRVIDCYFNVVLCHPVVNWYRRVEGINANRPKQMSNSQISL